ncbi:hypothetical protein U1Q18_004495 [Sarracenia purpurea var. burkii]
MARQSQNSNLISQGNKTYCSSRKYCSSLLVGGSGCGAINSDKQRSEGQCHTLVCTRMRVSLKEVRHLYEGMRLYMDGVTKQHVSHFCERSRGPRWVQLLAKYLFQALHQQVGRANSQINLGFPLSLIIIYELFQ